MRTRKYTAFIKTLSALLCVVICVVLAQMPAFAEGEIGPQKPDVDVEKQISFEKIWEDYNNVDATRPDEVKLILHNTVDPLWSYPITLTEESGWTFSLIAPHDIPDMEGVWWVEEVELAEGYTLRKISPAAIRLDNDNTDVTFEIINTWEYVYPERPAEPPEPTPEYEYISVNKVWVDNGYSGRHVAITAVLYRDGVRYKSVVLDESNGWTYTWKVLKEGHTWRVEEETVPEGYTGEVSHTGDSWTLTNTRKTTDVQVQKIWDDNNYSGRPAQATAVLYRDGTEYTSVILSEENGWKHTWAGLDASAVWTVDEANVPDGYSKSVICEGNAWTITNKTDVPATGDTFSIGLWLTLALCSLAGFLAVTVCGRKKGDARRSK